MIASTFTALFLVLLVITTLIEMTLSYRQSNSALKNQNSVPSDFKEIVKLKDHKKAAAYTSDKSKLNIINFFIQALFLLLLTIGGLINDINSFYSSLTDNQLIQGAAMIFSVLILSSTLDIPTGLYKTFVIDERYGFNKITLNLYVSDLFKQSIVSTLIMLPMILLALWIFGNLGDLWWLWLWLFLSIFNVLMLAIYPLYIAPLFNKFKPMEDIKLKNKIEVLLKKCGFESDGLFVMNGSLRSTHGNAYFTGYGNAKRIVFFDTLLEKLNHSEILAVLAHELGHFAHNHVKKRIVFLFLISFIGLFVLDVLKTNDWFYLGLGVETQTNANALILFVLISPLFLFFIRPLMASYSRKNEFEADEYACKFSSAKDLRDSLIKLYRDNASTLTPDAIYSSFYDSHPPALKRINALKKFIS